MTLDNGIVRLDFDDATGSLRQIRDLRAGRDFLADPREARLFRVFASDKENWIDRYSDSHQCGQPMMERVGDALTIIFPRLITAEGIPTGIAATVRVTLPPGAEEALFSLEIASTDPHTICEVIFPWVGGWHGFPGDRGTIQAGTHAPLDPFAGLRRNDGWNIMDFTRKTSIGFPHVNIPLCEVGNGKVGLSFNFYPQTRDLNFDLFVTDLNERIGEPHPAFGWVHRPFLRAGGTWTSGPVGMAPHEGDWHFAADRMRSWLATWWRPPASPAHLRTSIGFHNVMCRDFLGRHLRPLSDLPGIARHGLSNGVKDMIVWDMPLLGMYVRAGSGGIFEDSPERLAELKHALTEVKSSGVRVSPLTNMRLGIQAHPFWKEKGERWAIRSMYGMPAQETLPLRKYTAALINRYLDQGGVKFCQANPEFQEWALSNTRKVLDLGFNAIFIDQPFSEDYCFSDSHGHPPGVPGHEGTCSWIPRAARIVHGHGPDSYVVGEVPDIWNTQYFDLWWFWDWSWLKPEIFRYVMPDSTQSWVIDAYDHEDQMGKAFAQGFLFNLNVRSLEKTLADVPAFTHRVSQLAALRARTKDFTLAGRFMDRTGLTVQTDAEITASAYTTASGIGIILGEGTKKAAGGGAVKLTIDQRLLQGRPPGDITHYSKDGSAHALRAGATRDELTVEVPLSRWECAVIEVPLR
jgi:hypothetical protein